MSQRRARQARRAARAAADRPLLTVGDIAYLDHLGRISRAEALREVARFFRATIPPELPRPEVLIEALLHALRAHPVKEWVDVVSLAAQMMGVAPAPTGPTAIVAELPSGDWLRYVAGAGRPS
jgi:hypothetical protein